MLLDASADLLRSGQMRLDLIGDGPETPRLKDQAERLALGDALTFHCKMTMTMPFHYDAKTGQLRFLPDTSPKLKYTVSLPAPFDAIIGWLVRLFVHFFDAPIRSMITGIASSIQHVASPKVSSANWSGIRDFKTGAARVDGAIWLADTRPAETEAPKPVQLAWEIL